MSQGPDTNPDPALEEAERASRVLRSQVKEARRRLWRKYHALLREKPSWQEPR